VSLFDNLDIDVGITEVEIFTNSDFKKSHYHSVILNVSTILLLQSGAANVTVLSEESDGHRHLFVLQRVTLAKLVPGSVCF
jgi:hypothetical protein